MRLFFIILASCFVCFVSKAQQQHILPLIEGRVQFESDAPLEVIRAASEDLTGVLDVRENRFAFSLRIQSFQGFNNPLQQEHFNENYLESHVHPKATYSGKIIEDIDLGVPGLYHVRTKGRLVIHGVQQERIIKGVISVEKNRIRIQSSFTVPLEDHDISIPRIVFQKIAEEIQVDVDARF